MARYSSKRDPEREARERDRYIVLLHLYTLCLEGSPASVAPQRIARDLALSEAYEEDVVRDLVRAEMAAFAGAAVVPTARGVDYLERRAGRRRTIRLPE